MSPGVGQRLVQGVADDHRVGVQQQHVAALGDLEALVVGGCEAAVGVVVDEAHLGELVGDHPGRVIG